MTSYTCQSRANVLVTNTSPLSVELSQIPSITEQNTNSVIGSVLLGNSSMNDAFSRLRVSNPVTLFESSMEVDKQPLLWDEVLTGSGSTTYNINQSSLSLSTGAANSGVIRQSHQYVRYQPGKSLLVLLTGTLGTRATGVVRRMGLFDNNNGIFLEQTENDIAWVIRSYITGSAVDLRVSQNSWNIDILNGNGSSEYTLDENNTILVIIDLEWLGVGRVRVGFIIGGKIIYTHEFNQVIPTVYMQRASLPVRYEISTDATGSDESLIQICSTVISEGGFELKGMIRSIGNGTISRTITSGSYTPLVSIRLKLAYNKATLIPIGVDLISASGNLIHYKLIYRATVPDGAWISASEAVEYNVTGTSITGGYDVNDGYLSNQTRFSISEQESTTLTNGSDIFGTSDIIVVAAQSFSGNPTVSASIHWREIF